jgi:hypothetical protein
LTAQQITPTSIVWNTPQFCDPAIAQSVDHSFFEVRSLGAMAQSYFALSKIDSTGSPIWEKYFDWNPTQNWYDELHGIFALADSGVVLAGYQSWISQQNQTTPYSYHVLRLDKNGQILWQKKFIIDSTQLTGKIRVMVSSSGIITLISAASGVTNGGQCIHLLQCDLNGNYVNQKRINVASGMNSVEDATIYGGDTILITGYVPNNPFILKIDQNLQVVMCAIFTTNLHFYNVIRHPNGDFYVGVRSVYSNNTPRLTVLRLNNYFQILEMKSVQFSLSSYRVNCFTSGSYPSSNIYFGGSGFSGCYGFPNTSTNYLLTLDTGLNMVSSYKYFGEGPRAMLPHVQGPIVSTISYLGATSQYAINYFQTDTAGMLSCNFDIELPAIVADPLISSINWTCSYLPTNNVNVYNTNATVSNAWTSFTTFDFCLFNSGEEQPITTQLFIWPNPSGSTVHISGTFEDATLIISKIDGVTLRKLPVSEGMEVDISDLADGTYLFEVIDKTNSIIAVQLLVKAP